MIRTESQGLSANRPATKLRDEKSESKTQTVIAEMSGLERIKGADERIAELTQISAGLCLPFNVPHSCPL